MAAAAITSRQSIIVKQLIYAGIIPKNATSWELIFKANEPMRMKIDVQCTDEEIETITDAIMENEDEGKGFVKEILLRKSGDTTVRVGRA